MKIRFKQITSFALSVSMLFALCAPAISCAPNWPIAIMVNGTHPDLPLKFFAAGKLGVIQSGWAKSYLIVCYRYLKGIPLDTNEQTSIVNLWHKRLDGMRCYQEDSTPDECANYFKLRAKILGLKIRPNAMRYDFDYASNISDSSFGTALESLKILVKQFGEKSPEVKDWLKAQDSIFGVNASRTQGEVQKAPDSAPPLAKAYRKYQLAAHAFYANDMKTAQDEFESLAKDGNVSLTDIAWYMAARSAATAALDSTDNVACKAAIAYVQGLISKFPNSKYKADLVDLCQMIKYYGQPQSKSITELIDSVSKAHCNRFGNDVGDLTYMLDEGSDSSPSDSEQTDKKEPKSESRKTASPFNEEQCELSDWLVTIQQSDSYWEYLSPEERKKLEARRLEQCNHAMEKWKKTHSLIWLVAAISTNGLSSKKNPDLFKAAQSIPSQSPAYFTTSCYVTSALIEAGRKAEAHKLVTEILAKKDLPPSTRNMFMTQRIAASNNLQEYLKSIAQCPSTVTFDMDSTQLPSDWFNIEKRSRYFSEACTIVDIQSEDLDLNLPLSTSLSWAKDKTVPKELHKRLVRAAWMKSFVLGQNGGLDDELAAAYPCLKKYMSSYKSAAEGPEKNFAAARLVLHNYGMSPYIGGAIERHGETLDQFDYYNDNFWLPKDLPGTKKEAQDPDSYDEHTATIAECYRLGANGTSAMIKSYNKSFVRNLLNPEEKKQLAAEQKAIWKNHPSKLLGDAVISWSKSHPQDPDVPELLYRVCRLPKWCGVTNLGSNYSHKAYNILHSQYPKNQWTKKAVCWY